MKKFLLLTLITVSAGIFSPKANAYTAQEIAAKGKIWLALPQQYEGREQYANLEYYHTGDIDVKLTSDGYLELPLLSPSLVYNEVDISVKVGISGTTATVEGTTSSNVNNCYTPGMGLYVNYNNQTRRNQVLQVAFSLLEIKNNYFYGLISLDSSYKPINSKLTGTVTKDDDGNFNIKFGPYEFYKLYLQRGNVEIYDVNDNFVQNSNNDYYYKSDDVFGFSGEAYGTYSPNATITDIEYIYSDDNVKTDPYYRSYSAELKFLEGEKLTINNWANMGLPYNYTMQGNKYIIDYDKFYGSYDFKNKTVQINARPILADLVQSGRSVNVYDLYMSTDFSKTNGLQSPINGTMSYKVSHIGNSRWFNSNNSKTILSNIKVEFQDYYFCYAFGQNTLNNAYYANTQLNYNGEIDYTHSVDVLIHQASYGEVGWDGDFGKVLWVKGGLDLEKAKNSKLVDHYELYLKPGNVTDINAAGVHNDTGLIGAMNISDEKYWTGYNPTNTRIRTMDIKSEEELEAERQEAIRENSEGKFDRFVTQRDMEAAGLKPDPNGDYTVFVKTFYTAESGLEPTFHALTYLGDQITTVGVEDVIDDDSDANAPAVFYNMNGVQMNGDNLTPGIYIRRQGNTTTKVVIK